MRIKIGNSLELRISVITFLILFSILSIMTGTSIINQNKILLGKSEEKVNSFADVIATALRYPMMTGDQDVIQNQFDNYNKLKDIVVIHLVDDQGIIRRSTDQSLIGQKPDIDYLDKLLSGKEHHGVEKRRRTGQSIYAKADPIFNEPKCYGCHGKEKKVLGGLRIALDWSDEISEVNADRNRNILISFVGLLIIIIFLTIFLRRIILKPIKILEQGMQRVAAGDLSQKIVTQSQDELGKLAGMFNRMTEDLAGAMEIDRDITGRREIEKSQRFLQLGKMVGNMAHEVSNPLMVISGRAQLSLMEEIQNEDLKKNLQLIFQECQRAKDIIQRMLKFSRPSKGQLKETDINKCVEDLINLVEHQFNLDNIVIKRHYAGDLPFLMIDDKQLQEVFINLLNNSREAMAESGTVEIKTYREGDLIRIDFKDSGSGMSQEVLAKIFEPFFTTKEKGTGLGLSVSYGIVKNYGGDLKFTSSPGKGATASIFLPVKKGEDNA